MPRNNVKLAEGTQKKYCEGFWASAENGHYFLGVNLSVASVKQEMGGKGLLDHINAFDTAEVSIMNMGQTNMITVSSFCGPKGLIWGHDLCKNTYQPPLRIKSYKNRNVEIYSIDPLIESLQTLLGTVTEPRFPFLPGTHLPCAYKSIEANGPTSLYCALAIGIPEDRTSAACLLMEDVGQIDAKKLNMESFGEQISNNLVKSIELVGENQNIFYHKIFIGFKTVIVPKGHTGCALVAAPYFALAQDAYIPGVNLATISLHQWQSLITKK